MNIQGTTALVTGANRGIGAAIVDALVAAGAAKVYAASRTPIEARDRVVPVALDITDDGQVARVTAELSDVHILVNNAGVAAGTPLLGTTQRDAAEREMRVNYFGTLAMIRALAPTLEKNGGGAIVNILSILSHVNHPRVGSYSASKAAAFSLTQGIRAELPRTLVVGVMPAFVDTDMARDVPGPKLSPSAVADAVVQALLSGTEDVYPGAAAEIAANLKRAPKAVERQFAGTLR